MPLDGLRLISDRPPPERRARRGRPKRHNPMAKPELSRRIVKRIQGLITSVREQKRLGGQSIVHYEDNCKPHTRAVMREFARWYAWEPHEGVIFDWERTKAGEFECLEKGQLKLFFANLRVRPIQPPNAEEFAYFNQVVVQFERYGHHRVPRSLSPVIDDSLLATSSSSSSSASSSSSSSSNASSSSEEDRELPVPPSSGSSSANPIFLDVMDEILNPPSSPRPVPVPSAGLDPESRSRLNNLADVILSGLHGDQPGIFRLDVADLMPRITPPSSSGRDPPPPYVPPPAPVHSSWQLGSASSSSSHSNSNSNAAPVSFPFYRHLYGSFRSASSHSSVSPSVVAAAAARHAAAAQQRRTCPHELHSRLMALRRSIVDQRAQGAQPVCIGCMELAASVCFVDCGHRVMCWECTKKMIEQNKWRTEVSCPTCRKGILSVIKVIDS